MFKLIRLLLYGMGFPIPSTKGINFDSCIIQITLQLQDKELFIQRENDYITLIADGNEDVYVLPEKLSTVHSIIFQTDIKDVLENILGVFYIDQDRGWTLLNRGKVIGDIRFNVERLIRGISNRSCHDLEKENESITQDIKKYTQMLEVGKYQTKYLEQESFILPYDEREGVEKKLIEAKMQKKEIQQEIWRIEKTLQKNTNFRKYIEGMKLRVKAFNGEEIEVTEDTLVGFGDTQEIQKVKHKMLKRELSKISAAIDDMETELVANYLSVGETAIESFDRNISAVPINVTEVSTILKDLRERQKQIREEIKFETTINNTVINDLNDIIHAYGKELGIDKYIEKIGILTSELKSLSGAIYHKIVFIFRLAYVKALEKHLNLHLPIFIDSPSGREMSQENINDTMNILNRDFKHHQIVIASIHEYPAFENAKRILVRERLIDESMNEEMEKAFDI